MIIGRRLMPLLALGLTMAAFAEGVFDFLPEPPPEARPRAAIERAEAMLANGEVAGALHNLNRASQAIGETAEILLDIARCQIQLDQLNEAQNTLVRAIDTRLQELADGVRDWIDHRRDEATDAAVHAAMDRADQQVRERLAPDASGDPVPLFANQMAIGVGDANGTSREPSVSVAELPLPTSVPRDRLLSEAWTRLALIELRRSHHLETYGISEPGNIANAMMPADPAAAEAEAARRRVIARRYLHVATQIHPGNVTARELRDGIR